MVGRNNVEDHQTLLHDNYVSLMVSEKISEGSLATQFYINLRPLRCGQFGPQGLDWQDLSRGPLHTATY